MQIRHFKPIEYASAGSENPPNGCMSRDALSSPLRWPRSKKKSSDLHRQGGGSAVAQFRAHFPAHEEELASSKSQIPHDDINHGTACNAPATIPTKAPPPDFNNLGLYKGLLTD